MNRFGIVLILASHLLVLGGCQTTSSPVSNLGNRDRITGATVGAVLGGIAGGIIGHQSDRAAEGAAIGAVVGGGVGYVVGDTVAKRREKFADEAAYLEAETLEVEKALAAQRSQNEELRQGIKRVDMAIIRLEDARERGENIRDEKVAILAALHSSIDENERLDQDYRTALAYLTEAINTSTAEDEQAIQRKLQLEVKLEELRAEYETLVEQTERLREQRELLARM